MLCPTAASIGYTFDELESRDVTHPAAVNAGTCVVPTPTQALPASSSLSTEPKSGQPEKAKARVTAPPLRSLTTRLCKLLQMRLPEKVRPCTCAVVVAATHMDFVDGLCADLVSDAAGATQCTRAARTRPAGHRLFFAHLQCPDHYVADSWLRATSRVQAAHPLHELALGKRQGVGPRGEVRSTTQLCCTQRSLVPSHAMLSD